MNKPAPTSSEFKQPYYFEEDTISLIDIMLVLAKHFKIDSNCASIFCTLTIIYVLFIVMPAYTSTSKIMSSSGGGESQVAGIAAQFGLNIPTSSSGPKWVYPEIIQSRTLARSMLKRKFDTNKFGPQKSLLHILSGENRDQLGFETLEIKAVDKFITMINVSENARTGILTLKVIASEPNLSTEINRVLIEELDAHQRKYNKAKTSDAKQFIEERIIDVEKQLMAAEEDLKVFTDRNRRIENSPALQLEKQRLSREVAVITGVFTTLKQQLETTKIEEVKESDYVVVLDSPEIPLSRSSPNRKRAVILAGIFGLGLGLVLAFIKEYFTNRDKEEKDKLYALRSLIIRNISELIPGKTK